MALTIDNIIDLYCTTGAARYGMEAINQEQHALQCALLAEQAGSSPELVAAALLHDLGHLLAAFRPNGEGKNDLHEYVAIPFLRGLVPDAVIEPIRLHVDAKRYLCSAQPDYWDTLSAASKRSLELQGGAFSEAQACDFIALPFARDAVALRRWDDCAKTPGVVTPAWDHYGAVLERAALAERSGV